MSKSRVRVSITAQLLLSFANFWNRPFKVISRRDSTRADARFEFLGARCAKLESDVKEKNLDLFAD